MKITKWYYSTWFIAFLFVFWFLIIPLIIGLILLFKQKREIKSLLISFGADKQELYKLQEELFEEVIQQEKEQEERIKIKIYNKQKEIARLNLLSKLKSLVLNKEIQCAVEKHNKFIQEKEVRHREELESQTLVKEKEIAVSKLLAQLNLISSNRAIEQGNRVINRETHQLIRLNKLKNLYMKEIIVLRDEILFQSFGFYDTRYDLEDSQEYKEMLDKVRANQKEAVKYDLAVEHYANWLLNNSSRQGEAMNKKNIKMTIRSFNNECDTVIHKVKFNNIESSEKKIRKARIQIDKLNQYNQIMITDHYLDLKLEELYLAYEYAEKKQEEREEQRRQNELLREENRVRQEIEERRKILLKEEEHYRKALARYLNQLKNADERLSYDLKKEIERTEQGLKKIEEEKSELDYRVRNAKAGYVYVISNMGAFGENVFKIGMTRRLEPLERIRELSAASVPFIFDVHAMIFSEDAPALENALHKTFHENRVNKVNNRKEFFRVSLKEIEKIIRENHNKPVEFTKLGIAREYRETLMIEKQESKKNAKKLLTVS